MRDYIRKQNRKPATRNSEIVKRINPEKPLKYKGKFKLETWSHKTRTKALDARRSRASKSGVDSKVINVVQLPKKVALEDLIIETEQWRPPDPVFFSELQRLDPFNSFPITLDHRSQRLLLHCMYHS